MWEVVSFPPVNAKATRVPSAEMDGCLSAPSQLATGEIWNSDEALILWGAREYQRPAIKMMTVSDPSATLPQCDLRDARGTAGSRPAIPAAAKASATTV